MYDEDCKIVADWKWFVSAILYNNASYEFVPLIIAISQEGGISQTDKMFLERLEQRKKIFPDFISPEDENTLFFNSIIQSFRVTRFLYKAVKCLAYQLCLFKRKRSINRLYTYDYR